MSIPPFSASPHQGDAFYAPKSGQSSQWTIISTHPWFPGSGRATGSTNSTHYQTYSYEQCAPVAIDALYCTFANYIRDTGVPTSTGYWGEMSNYNPIAIQAKVVLSDGSEYPLWFNGCSYGVCGGTALLNCDPLRIHIPAGALYQIVTTPAVLHYNTPSAPTVADSGSSSAISAGNYFLCYRRVYGDGSASVGSTASTVLAVTAGHNIVMTSPADPGDSSVGYQAFCSLASGANTSPFYRVSPTIPWGNDATIKAVLTSTTFYGAEAVIPGLWVIPIGTTIAGGTGAGGGSNEYATAVDVFGAQRGYTRSYNTSNSGGYGPVAIYGLTPYANQISVAVIGDSREQGVGDNGFRGSNDGGFWQRVLMRQTTSLAFDRTITNPFCGFVKMGSSGESAYEFANSLRSGLRSSIAGNATHWCCNYGINDCKLALAGYSAGILANLYTICNRCVASPQRTFIWRTMEPFTSSTDGFQTIANQLWPNDATAGHTGNLAEPTRRAVNRIGQLAAGAALAVTGETPFGNYAGNLGPASNPFAGGDAVCTQWATAYPFVQASQSVTVAGVAKALTTDYTYLGTATIGGIAYASGIQFNSAPANGAAVLISYTSMPGMRTTFAAASGAPTSRILTVDPISAVEVDANGAAAANGGWWKPTNTASPTVTFTAAAGSTTSAIAAPTGYTQDQFRGKVFVVVADPGTPTALYGCGVCISNPATPASIAITGSTLGATFVAPSSSATIDICDGYTLDGGHCSSLGYKLMAATGDLSIFVLPQLPITN